MSIKELTLIETRAVKVKQIVKELLIQTAEPIQRTKGEVSTPCLITQRAHKQAVLEVQTALMLTHPDPGNKLCAGFRLAVECNCAEL